MAQEKIIVSDKINCEVIRSNKMDAISHPIPKTWWNAECYDSTMKRKWVVENECNLVTNEGKNANLNIMFHASTQISTWYFVLFENDYTPLVTNTYSVPGYTETIVYDESIRPAFVEAISTAQSLTNIDNKAVFTFNSSKNIYGGALVGGGTDPTVKGNTAGGGVLYSSSKFTELKPVSSGDVLKIWITLTAS